MLPRGLIPWNPKYSPAIPFSVCAPLRAIDAGVPVAPLTDETSAEADRNRQWREVGVGAQILRDLGVTSIRNLTSSVHDYKGLSGFGIEIAANEQLES